MDSISCVLLDYHLESMTGVDLLLELEELGYDKTAFLVTGASGMEISDFDCNTLIGVIPKPFVSKELKVRFRMFLSS